jgi:hypothetical protein
LHDTAYHTAGTGNNHTAEAMMHHSITPDVKRKREELSEKLDKLLRPFEERPVITHDPHFIRKQSELYTKLIGKVQEALTGHLIVGVGDEGGKDFLRERLVS